MHFIANGCDHGWPVAISQGLSPHTAVIPGRDPGIHCRAAKALAFQDFRTAGHKDETRTLSGFAGGLAIGSRDQVPGRHPSYGEAVSHPHRFASSG